jgi:hypothetical protein
MNEFIHARTNGLPTVMYATGNGYFRVSISTVLKRLQESFAINVHKILYLCQRVIICETTEQVFMKFSTGGLH